MTQGRDFPEGRQYECSECSWGHTARLTHDHLLALGHCLWTTAITRLGVTHKSEGNRLQIHTCGPGPFSLMGVQPQSLNRKCTMIALSTLRGAVE